MRSFVLLAHEAPTEPEFNLDALPQHGRLDLVSRFLTSALLTSHGVRGDTTCYLVLQDTLTVKVDGGEVGGLNPDERSVAGVLRRAVEEAGYREHEVQRGVYVSPEGLEDVLEQVEGEVYWLREDGEPAAETPPAEDSVLVFSDHLEFTEGDVDVLEGFSDRRVSLGSTALHADDAAAASHVWLDTDGYSSY